MKSKFFLTILSLVFFHSSVIFAAGSNEKGIYFYNPPKENFDIRRRVGGSDYMVSRRFSRGFPSGKNQKGKETKIPLVIAPIAPANVGITSSRKPTLFFYVSSAWPHDIEITLNDENMIDPVLKTNIKGPLKKGIVMVDLEKYGVILNPGVEYEWFATIVTDNNKRYADFFCSAVLKYVKPSNEFLEKIKNASEEEIHSLYAEAGYFYDAMESLSRLVNSNKETKKFRLRRASLNEQVKLLSVSEYDRTYMSRGHNEE